MAKPSIKQYVYRTASAMRVPVSGTFELTARCNLNCRMCYVHMSADQQKACGRELSTQQWLDLGRHAVDAGMVYLLLTGGEPMLRPDFLDIYTGMVNMGVLISINTNGTCLTPEIVDCFRKHPPEQVNVTIYGASSETYQTLCGSASGYEKAKQGILMLKEAGIRVALNTTFTTCNKADMEDLVAFAKEHSLPIRTAAYVFPKVRNGHEEQTITLGPEDHGRLTAQFEFLTMPAERLQYRRQQIQKCLDADNTHPAEGVGRNSSCMAGRGAFWISWDGKMFSCGMLPEDYADVSEQSFRECWAKICSGMNHVYLPAECSVCRYDPICPVCAALTQSLSGDSAAVPKEMCRYIRAYSEEFLSMTIPQEGRQNTDASEDPEQIFPCIL